MLPCIWKMQPIFPAQRGGGERISFSNIHLKIRDREKEIYKHLILDGFFTGKGYLVQSERESGYGRSDLFILDPGRMRCLVLELKHEKDESEMETAIKEASGQIVRKHYESVLKYEGYTTCLKYSIAFCDKKCLIKQVD